MTSIGRFTTKQLNALFCACAVLLFGVMTQVNTLDNIEHLASAHHHEHSLFSVVDSDHHDEGGGTTTDDEDTNKNGHSHPNLTGSVLFPDMKHFADQHAYGIAVPTFWQRFDGLQTRVTLAHERPPKILA